ncbi:unnamed protein product [Cylicocyclus nassatus]|uniref:Uncharacterized protein n=1 Tax=Cylicocyclus nassatus TaxID=53992 RepID=A0AA36M2K5_CYLNA|nr:unnamed protein product [Cylicocyclus nassatus]
MSLPHPNGPSTDHVKNFEKNVDKQVPWNRVEEWSDKNITEVFKQAQPGDEIDVKLTVDFSKASRYTTTEEKKEFMRRIAELEARYMPR